jgi:2'-5' RNA ligase
LVDLTPTGRVFAALVPPPEVAMALSDRLSAFSIPGRPVPPDNWHVTLRFVGKVDDVTYDRWLGALDQVSAPPIRVAMAGLGAFPHARRATVLWAGVESVGIDGLAVAVEDATQAAGIAPEERPFRPHLTLARIRPPVDVSAQVKKSAEMPGLSWTADSFHVMSAVGSRYAVHETFELA